MIFGYNENMHINGKPGVCFNGTPQCGGNNWLYAVA
jgi:hypothetical protein